MAEEQRYSSDQQEYRFAVVMYGGVSLAIYMNGISQEMLSLVRATDGHVPNPNGPETTRDVYRELAFRLRYKQKPDLSIGPLPQDKMQGKPPTSFVIDILSGTSAGGINAVFLAKALAQDNDRLDELQAMWRSKADIDTLLNDKHSLKDGTKTYRSAMEKTSLLNSQRMYGMLHEAFEKMDTAPKVIRRDGNPKPKRRIDLYVTATDLNGILSPIQLADGVVSEHIHKHAFHFVDDGDGGDFHQPFNPMLAFAARCTSSFPAAFEPMTLKDAFGVLSGINPDRFETDMSGFFGDATTQGTLSERTYADGGYLDNKPFGHAINALRYRHADKPVERKLFFINPFAQPFDPSAGNRFKEFNFISNTTAALTTLPRQETIRQDVDALNSRNRWLRRVNVLIHQIEKHLAEGKKVASLLKKQKQLENKGQATDGKNDGGFQNTDLGDLIQIYGSSYAAYHYAKVYSVSDFLAEMVTLAAGFNLQSDLYRAIRFLVQAWRKANYASFKSDDEAAGKKTENEFLTCYDLDFRIRRLGFIQSQLQQWLAGNNLPLFDEFSPEDHRQTGEDYLAAIRKQQQILYRLRRVLTCRGAQNPISASLPALNLTVARLQEIIQDSEYDACYEAAQHLLQEIGLDVFQKLADHIHECIAGTDAHPGTIQVNENLDKLRDQAHQQTLDGKGQESTDPLIERLELVYFTLFDYRDSLVFPLIASGDYGEGDEVEIFRISPIDATSIQSFGTSTGGEKLAGISLGAFGGFLDPVWRENDILWGRLDGAERLIKAILPRPGQAEVRRHYIERAQAAILNEIFDPPSRTSSLPLLYKQKMEAASDGVPTTPMDYFRGQYNLDTNLNNVQSLDRVGRTSQIVSSMFKRLEIETAGAKKAMSTKISKWAARLGKGLSGLAEFSVPMSMTSLIARHWSRLIALAAVLLIVIGVFFGEDSIKNWGWISLLVVFLFFVLHWCASSFIGEAKRWGLGWLRWVFQFVFFSVLVTLMLSGTVAWFEHPEVMLDFLQKLWPF